jgi:hypothetical protein
MALSYQVYSLAGVKVKPSDTEESGSVGNIVKGPRQKKHGYAGGWGGIKQKAIQKGLLLPVTRIFIVVLSTYIIARTLSTYNIVDICFLLCVVFVCF